MISLNTRESELFSYFVALQSGFRMYPEVLHSTAKGQNGGLLHVNGSNGCRETCIKGHVADCQVIPLKP